MGSLFAALRSASSALQVFERGLAVVQSNVSNASTPGYAKQLQGLEALATDLDHGLAGGVASTGTVDSRSSYLDNAVRQRMESWGSADEMTQQLARLEPVFDISSKSGVVAGINGLMQAVSAAAVAPNDPAARKVVLERASALAQSLNAAAKGLSDVRTASGLSLANDVKGVNELAGQVAEINLAMSNDITAQQDPGLQAKLHNTLEDLSELVDVTVIYAADGSASVYAGGQTPIVLGDKQFSLSADVSGQPVKILAQDGTDISGQISGGRLGALLEFNNTVLPAHEAELNHLAESVADGVNATLATGVDLNGAAPVQGLFTYDTTLGSARSLQTTTLSADELALADPAAPGGNAVALKLEALFNGKSIDGVTYSQFYGNSAAAVGRELDTAQQGQTAQEQLTLQAQEMRDVVQKVNLNEEAVKMMEFQRAYQASAQLIQVLDELTQTTIDMLR